MLTTQLKLLLFGQDRRVAPKLIFAASLLWSVHALAQDSRVLVQNASTDATTVLIKWYTEQLIYPEGVNIYRKESSSTDWIKLNVAPIKKDESLGDQLILSDTSFIPFVVIPREEKMEDLRETVFFLYMLVKSFDSNGYARHLGLNYEDLTARPGTSYVYRVMRIVGGRETILGQSEAVEAGKVIVKEPVHGLDLQQDGLNVSIDWQVDDDRFYAINIYRTASSGDRQKITERPILLSEVTDSLGRSGYPSPKYVDLDLDEGAAYSYELEGLGYFGKPLPLSEAKRITISDVTPPPPPTNFEVEIDSFNIRFQWSNPEAPDIREIELRQSRSSEGPYSAIFSTQAETSYERPIFDPGPHYFHVVSIDHAGNEAVSQTRFVDIPDQKPPAAPVGLVIASDTGRLALSWQPNGEADLLGYQIFRTVEGGSDRHYTLLTADPIASTTYVQELPSNIQNRFLYYIVAVDSALNQSGPSNRVVARMPDVLGPERPNITRVEYVDEAVQLLIRPNVDPDLMGYKMFRADSLLPLDFQQVGAALLEPGDIWFVDETTEAGGMYLYQVVALDSAGNLSAASVPVFASLPAIPKDLKVKASLKYRKRRAENLITWSEPAGAWLGYVVYKGTANRPMKPATGLIQSTEYRDMKLEEATSYQVRAYSEAGEIIQSDILKWEK